MPEEPHYQQPDWFTRNIMNRAVATATRLGVSLFGSRILRVRGRTSGLWRETPVNLLSLDGDRYLVAPRGETQWVRNMRAAGGGELRVGRRIEPFHAQELAPADKNPALRAYLKRWRWEVGAFFGDVHFDSSEEAVTAQARKHPIFRITAAWPTASADSSGSGVFHNHLPDALAEPRNRQARTGGTAQPTYPTHGETPATSRAQG